MGMNEAKRYVRELRKRQNDPFLWPDYLTGLPGKAAILRKFGEIRPRLGKYAVSYVRIANVEPYLFKYGADRHADIIQWAAAVLKTGYGNSESAFVGVLNTHDFIVMGEAKDMVLQFKKAARLFRRRVETFYSKDDLKKGTTLSFRRDGMLIKIGLMRLVASVVERKTAQSGDQIFRYMARHCQSLEHSQTDVTVIEEDQVSRGLE